MKRILCTLLVLLICASAATGVYAMDTTLTTSDRHDSGLLFSVEKSTLTVSGAVDCPSLEKIWIRAGSEETILAAADDQPFTASLSLPATSDAPIPVIVATKQTGVDTYWSYIWQTVFLTATAEGYQFTSAPAYEWNRTVLDAWVNPADHLAEITEPSLVSKAAEITAGLTDDYQKALAIHRWVADNIAYDYDTYNGKTQNTPLTPAEVLAAGYTVCTGYARLVQALCQAQGIPCRTIDSFGAGAGTDGFISTEDMPGLTKANHTHAAAWLNGRWVHMDTAWDSPHRYENGVLTRGVTAGLLYFDAALPFFSLNHKLLSTIVTSPENTPSDWAIPEVRDALSKELVPYALQNGYGTAVSRADFCTLLMTMLQRRTGCASLSELAKLLQTDPSSLAFTDIEGLSHKDAILTAASLGIVNGRGNGIFDPDSGITRQEAAVMLTRAARVLEIPMGTPRTFADMQDAADWAASGILYVSSLVTPAVGDTAGKAVMGGVSETKFQPLGQYTLEQAILTMVRLFAVQ